jgi:hypothetical protein
MTTPDQLATPGGKSLGDEQLLAIVDAATPGPYVQSEGTPSRVDTPSGAITIAWSDSRDENPFDRAERQAAFIATFAPPTVKALILRAQAAEAAWTWLAANTSYELSHGYDDREEAGFWQVHRVNGGVNDREWTRVATGSTPLAAIEAARALQTKGARE